MKIKGSEIEEETRKRYMLDDISIFTLKEIKPYKGAEYRLFQLYDESGDEVCILWEDHLPPSVLE